MKHQLILASSSPRRKELLELANIHFQVRTKQIDESIIQASNPIEKVEQLAYLKGNAVPHSDEEVILAADTVVTKDGMIYGKPKDKQQAREMIQMLSGQSHEVYTGVYIKNKHTSKTIVEKTTVTFWTLTDEEIESYISSQDPYDKAGAYGIQSEGAILVKGIEGDFYNVVGLPISKVTRALRSFHIYPTRK